MPHLKNFIGLAALAIIGCGGSNQCSVIGLNVVPSTITVAHSSPPPANGETFSASNLFSGGSVCAANAAAAVTANWTASDASVPLSATQGQQVTATCTAALANPVTIQATAVNDSTLTGKATLVCQ